jgi:hypothetical protein
MPDITNISDQITRISGWLTDTVKKLDKAGLDKATAIVAHDQALALAEAKLRYLKGSKLYQLLLTIPRFKETDPVLLSEVEQGGSVPATLIPKIAAGIVSTQKLDMEVTDVNYRAIITKIEVLRAQLNAEQSKFRHLSHT